jgi:hypothetical protein
VAYSPQIGLTPSLPIQILASQTVVTSLSVPVGSYIVTAKVVLTNGSSGASSVMCQLTSTGSSSILDRADVVLPDSGAQTLTLHAAVNVTFFLGEHLRASCQVGSPAVAFATSEQLTAIQIQSLTVTGP